MTCNHSKAHTTIDTERQTDRSECRGREEWRKAAQAQRPDVTNVYVQAIDLEIVYSLQQQILTLTLPRAYTEGGASWCLEACLEETNNVEQPSWDIGDLPSENHDADGKICMKKCLMRFTKALLQCEFLSLTLPSFCGYDGGFFPTTLHKPGSCGEEFLFECQQV